MTANLGQHLENPVTVQVLSLQQLCDDRAALGRQSQQQMLDTDVTILEPGGLFLCLEQQSVETRRHIDLARLNSGAGDTRFPVKLRLQCFGQMGWSNIQLFQQARHQTTLLLNQGQEQVFTIDFNMTTPGGNSLRLLNSFLAFLGQFVDIHGIILCLILDEKTLTNIVTPATGIAQIRSMDSK